MLVVLQSLYLLLNFSKKKMTHDILEKLFGSATKVKVMKLFLFNRGKVFPVSEIIRRTKSDSSGVKKELRNLGEIGFVKEKVAIEENPNTGRKKKVTGYISNPDFPYIETLSDMLIEKITIERSDILKRLAKAGKIKLVILSGVFLKNEDSTLDILVVGEDVREKMLRNIISTLEAEIGTELRYAVFSTQDFKYRIGIYDRLVRDILDFAHEVVVDRIGLPTNIKSTQVV